MVLNWINKRFGIRLMFDVYMYFQNRIQIFLPLLAAATAVQLRSVFLFSQARISISLTSYDADFYL